MKAKEIKKFLLSKKGLTPEERKEIEHANDHDLEELFSEFKKEPNQKKKQNKNDRFNDVWF